MMCNHNHVILSMEWKINRVSQGVSCLEGDISSIELEFVFQKSRRILRHKNTKKLKLSWVVKNPK